jgi:type II secretory pathway pseudopilin PulG
MVGVTAYLLLFVVIAVVAVVAVMGVVIAVRPIQQAREAERLARAQRDFHRQREPLEAKFIERAAASGKPRGLRWLDVEFDDDVVYARDRRTGRLKALVAIEVSFEAVAGGGMEEVEAVSRVRAATAEFIHDGGRWQTNGRVYFNMAPSATVRYLTTELEMVAEEHAIPRA